MTWYGASLIFATKVVDGEQEKIPISEEVYLVHAPDDEEAWQIAKEIGRHDQLINDKVEFNGRVARREFLGIRKLRSIYNPVSMDDIDQEPPTNGSEITRSNFEVVGQESLDDLMNGKPVTVLYVDGAI
jgi:hypothetical protein